MNLKEKNLLVLFGAQAIKAPKHADGTTDAFQVDLDVIQPLVDAGYLQEAEPSLFLLTEAGLEKYLQITQDN